MTALDMTADAEEYRAIASQWHGGQASALYAYASSGTIVPGLSLEIRRAMSEIEAIPRMKREYGDFAGMYQLSKLLGHVSTLEDALREERS